MKWRRFDTQWGSHSKPSVNPRLFHHADCWRYQWQHVMATQVGMHGFVDTCSSFQISGHSSVVTVWMELTAMHCICPSSPSIHNKEHGTCKDWVPVALSPKYCMQLGQLFNRQRRGLGNGCGNCGNWTSMQPFARDYWLQFLHGKSVQTKSQGFKITFQPGWRCTVVPPKFEKPVSCLFTARKKALSEMVANLLNCPDSFQQSPRNFATEDIC